MKKHLLFSLLTSLIGNTCFAQQDTLIIHYNGAPPTKYIVQTIDSLRFVKGGTATDTLKIHFKTYGAAPSTGYPIPLAGLDSITFRKADTTDYTTPEGFELLTALAYTPLKFWYGKEDGMGMSEMGTDIWTAGAESYFATGGLANENRPLMLYSHLTDSNLNVARQWKQMYAGVNLCNWGIQIAQENGFPDNSPQGVRKAELHFLRAFYYWHIVETWGNAPLLTKPFYYPYLVKNRSVEARLLPSAKNSTVDSLYKLIEYDLQYAIGNLPAIAPEYGRAAKRTAQALLARVYLNRGLNFQAKDLADQIIQDGRYALLAYTDLWDMDKEQNKEVVWAIPYLRDPNLSDVFDLDKNVFGYGSDILSSNGNPTNNRGNNNLHTLFIPGYDRASAQLGGASLLNRTTRDGWPFIRTMPTRFLLDLFDESKDSRYAGSFQTTWRMNRKVLNLTNKLRTKNPYEADGVTLKPYHLRDTAFTVNKGVVESPNYYTINVYDNYNEDGSSKSPYNNQLFPALLKFKDSTRTASPDDLGSGGVQSSRDVPVFRLAEMYLISAEAAMREGDLASSANYLNILRQKRAWPGKDLSVPADSIDLDFILDERARELAGENIRWFDLKRTGKLIERVRNYNPDAGRNIQEFHMLRPIPKAQLDLTPSLQQNPGYQK